jgi:Ring finger domain
VVDTSMHECAICSGDFENNDVMFKYPVCNHEFHRECVDVWMNIKLQCPLCRKKFRENFFSQLKDMNQQLDIPPDEDTAVEL